MAQSKLSHFLEDTARKAGAKARLTSDETNIKSYSPVEHLELLMQEYPCPSRSAVCDTCSFIPRLQ